MRSPLLPGAHALCALGLCLLPPAARADGPVLHEYLEAVAPHEATLQVMRERGDADPVVYDGEVLSAPDLAADRPVPLMSGRPGDGIGPEQSGQRSPSFRPDRLTALEGQLDYFSAFNPVVAPFKRVTSLDAVVLASDGMTPVLTVADAARRPIPVAGPSAPSPDGRARDRFWGEVGLDFGSGHAVPLPSVAPSARILQVLTRPEVKLSFARDGADNFFALLDGGRMAGPVRLAFLTDAPRDYFGTDIPGAPVGVLAANVPPMPASVRARGLRFAAELGLTPGSELREAVHTLVGHFRAFEESEQPPDDSGDIYLDLARGMRGICRHRVYAFVITAQSLGIPARFVQNEAHAFAEVQLPGETFMRIDLGGAAAGVTAHGASDRPRYRPAQPDGLPRPPAYERSYSRAAQGVSGLRPPLAEQDMGGWVTPDGPLPEPAADAAADGAGGGASDGDGAPRPTPPVPAAGAQGPLGSPRVAMRLQLAQTRSVARRGRSVVVAGTLTDARGRPRPGMRVEVSLSASDGQARLLLGVAATDGEGAFRAELGLPADLPLGDYHLHVVAPGDDEYLPAVAR